MQRRITTSSHIQERGFTIAEIVLVIVVTTTLVAISVGSLGNYLASARDRQRIADINLISQNIERYYRTHVVSVGATYPVSTVGAAGLTTLIDNADATKAPDQTTSSMVIASTSSAQTPTKSQYIYQPLNVDGSLCTTVPCERYKLFYRLEVTNTVISVDSLRQQ